MSHQSASATSYYVVFGALIALTVLTIGVSFIELGAWHTVVGMIIATCKATLVVLFFMHLLVGRKLPWLALGGGLFWLAILIGLTLTDYQTRHWLGY
jgi:cytochrome c oxidase subunit IV